MKRSEVEQAVTFLLDASGEWSDERRMHLAVLEAFTQSQRDALDSGEPPQFGTSRWLDERP